MAELLAQFHYRFGHGFRNVFNSIQQYYYRDYGSQIPQDWAELMAAEFEGKIYILLMFAFYLAIAWTIITIIRKGISLWRIL